MLRLAALCMAVSAAGAADCSGKQTAMDMVAGRDMAGKSVVMTGGDSGIGYQTAIALASANASLVILSYDAKGRGAEAAANITRITGNSDVRVTGIDLSSFDSVRAAAKAVAALTPSIDVLINDAGIACVAVDVLGCVSLSRVTKDGFERVIQTNYLGHYLLTDLLLPALRKVKGRVVHVASDSAKIACLWAKAGVATRCTDLDKVASEVRNGVPLAPPSSKYPAGEPVNNTFGIPASYYGLSKYMMVFHAAELAKREAASGVTVWSLHPGAVATPMFDPLHQKGVSPLVPLLMCEGHKPCPLSPEEGAAGPAYMAAAPITELVAEAPSGAFFTYCKKASSVIDARVKARGADETAEYQSQLFNLTANWTTAVH